MDGFYRAQDAYDRALPPEYDDDEREQSEPDPDAWRDMRDDR